MKRIFIHDVVARDGLQIGPDLKTTRYDMKRIFIHDVVARDVLQIEPDLKTTR